MDRTDLRVGTARLDGSSLPTEPSDNPPERKIKPALAKRVRRAIRDAHSLLARRQLESKIAIYFHELEPAHWPEFRDAIQYFTSRGYRCVGVSEFLAAAPEERCLFVSFDDNFRNWHRALPMLQDLGVTATFYVNTLPFRDVASRSEIALYLERLALPAGHETLTRSELCELRDAGHGIGCHSHAHHVLSRLPPGRWPEEILQSKSILETILGEPVRHFAWPYGMRRYFSENLRRYCHSIGFETIANAIPGCQRISRQDPLNIFRTDWHFGASVQHNIENLEIDGRFYAVLTGRSVIG